VLVMDGYGDRGATSAYLGTGNRLSSQWQLGFFDSLGALYSSVTRHLGFEVFEEGTVMALAACGGPTYVERFREVIQLLPDNTFRIDPAYASFHTHGLVRPLTQKFIDTFGPARRRDEKLRDEHRDLAHALQLVTEEAVLHLVRGLEKRTAVRNLCLSGGVALNCVANARILRDTSFERVWVPPCASDTGAPLGAALWHNHQTLGNPRQYELTHAFHGAGYTDDEIQTALANAGLGWQRFDDTVLYDRVARDIADKLIVGWFQGRSEIGPRALGHRSILSDPRDAAIKEVVNERIKKREPFRPFAPAVLAERAAEYFEIAQTDPFMTLAPRVRPEKAASIAAAVHVDGTGRIQTVDKASNPRFHALISAFARHTGVPVLINTSFNRQEPVVDSPADAVSCYLRTGMDVLVLGNYYTRDRNPQATAWAHERFAVRKGVIAADQSLWRQAFRP
jgi:carbamoyltransferase